LPFGRALASPSPELVHRALALASSKLCRRTKPPEGGGAADLQACTVSQRRKEEKGKKKKWAAGPFRRAVPLS